MVATTRGEELATFVGEVEGLVAEGHVLVFVRKRLDELGFVWDARRADWKNVVASGSQDATHRPDTRTGSAMSHPGEV